MQDFKEYPGKGLRGIVDGRDILLGSSEFAGNNDDFKEANSSSKVYLRIENRIKGFFELKSQYREGLKAVVDKLNLESELSLLSGDNAAEQGYLESVFPSKSVLRFKQSAYDKLEYVKGLQSKNIKVMMVGDGLNDAGALAQANIGVAVTEDVNNFTPASDVILSGRAFSRLPQILKISSATVSVIIVSFIISFLYNVIGIGFAITGNLTPVFAAILMPLSSISVVLFTSISVNWKAARLGFK